MEIVAVILGLTVSVGIWTVLFKPVFASKDGFFECVIYYFKPDFWSWMQGEWGEDFWSTLKLNFWLISGALVGNCTYLGIVVLI